MLKARRIARLLQAHAEVDQVHHDLHMALRLHLPAHHTETDPRPAILRDERRDDRLKRTFARRISVELSFLEIKQRPAILQRETQPLRRHARTEAQIQTLNQRYHVPLPVRRRQINRVAVV